MQIIQKPASERHTDLGQQAQQQPYSYNPFPFHKTVRH